MDRKTCSLPIPIGETIPIPVITTRRTRSTSFAFIITGKQKDGQTATLLSEKSAFVLLTYKLQAIFFL